MTFAFHPEAEAELQEAIYYFEECQHGLYQIKEWSTANGDDFQSSLAGLKGYWNVFPATGVAG